MLHNVPTRPTTRYFQAPRWTGFTLFQPQLHSSIGRYATHLRKPANESDAICEYFPGQQSLN
jgi:hypothetical protein